MVLSVGGDCRRQRKHPNDERKRAAMTMIMAVVAWKTTSHSHCDVTTIQVDHTHPLSIISSSVCSTRSNKLVYIPVECIHTARGVSRNASGPLASELFQESHTGQQWVAKTKVGPRLAGYRLTGGAGRVSESSRLVLLCTRCAEVKGFSLWALRIVNDTLHTHPSTRLNGFLFINRISCTTLLIAKFIVLCHHHRQNNYHHQRQQMYY